MAAEERLQAVEAAINTLQSQVLNKIPRADASDALLVIEEEVKSLKTLSTNIADKQLELNDRLRKLTAAFQTAQDAQ